MMLLWFFICVLSFMYQAMLEPVTLVLNGNIEISQNWKYEPLVARINDEIPTFPVTVTHSTKPTTRTVPTDPLIEILKSFNFDNTSNIEQHAELKVPKKIIKYITPDLTDSTAEHKDLSPSALSEFSQDDVIKTYNNGSDKVPGLRITNFDFRNTRKTVKRKRTKNTTSTMKMTTIISNNLHKLLAKLGVTLSPTAKTKTTKSHWSTKSRHRVTKFYLESEHENSEILYEKAHLVKSNPKIKNFTLHIFKRHLNIFNNIKAKLNNANLRLKIDQAARSYINKFADFVNDTQHRKVVTKLGTQKVVLNTIETSNRIMNRLLTFLLRNMEEKDALRYFENTATKFKSQVDNEEQQQYVDACEIFHICRSKNSFSTFLSDFFTILLQTKNKKLKQGIDALTEVLKDIDLHRIMDRHLKVQLQNNIEAIERMEPEMLRPMIWMFRNMLVQKNQPIVLQPGYNQIVLNKSVALLDLIDILDEEIPTDEKNTLELNDIRDSLIQWAHYQRNDIQEIMKEFIKLVQKKGISRMNPKLAKVFHDNLRIVLKRRDDEGNEKEIKDFE